MADNRGMKTTLLVLIAGAVLNSVAFAGDSYVHGYTRSNGTYVQGYHRTTPDNTINNNYGTQGNQNPFTGSYGTVQRDDAEPAGNYNNGNGFGNSGIFKPSRPEHDHLHVFGE